MDPDVDAIEAELAHHSDVAFDEAGVDVTQVDLLLAMTPRERLKMLYDTAFSLARLMRNANAD
jgi:hypothetical protein